MMKKSEKSYWIHHLKGLTYQKQKKNLRSVVGDYLHLDEIKKIISVDAVTGKSYQLSIFPAKIWKHSNLIFHQK